VEWAKRIPHFSDLTLEDQVILLRAGKNISEFLPSWNNSLGCHLEIILEILK
jgi:hypothetical protein